MAGWLNVKKNFNRNKETGMPYFRQGEFACGCGCGLSAVDPYFVAGLKRARRLAKIPFTVLSGCRCAKHNAEVGGKPGSLHLPGVDGLCRAADIRAPDAAVKLTIVGALLGAGFQRVCVYKDKSIIHVDGGYPQHPAGLYVL